MSNAGEKIMIQMSRRLRDEIDAAAKEAGCSSNDYIEKLLELVTRLKMPFTHWLQCEDLGNGVESVPLYVSSKTMEQFLEISRDHGKTRSILITGALNSAMRRGWDDLDSMIECLIDFLSATRTRKHRVIKDTDHYLRGNCNKAGSW